MAGQVIKRAGCFKMCRFDALESMMFWIPHAKDVTPCKQPPRPNLSVTLEARTRADVGRKPVATRRVVTLQ